MYLKDFFSKDGKFVSSQEIHAKLCDKRKWIANTFKIYSTIKPYLKLINMKNAQFTNIPNVAYIKTKSRLVLVKEQKLYFFYHLLITKKLECPIVEKLWERKFEINIHKCKWKEIYKNKVFENVERKIAEFNYKLLFRLIPCNLWLHKCKLKDNKTCRMWPGRNTRTSVF